MAALALQAVRGARQAGYGRRVEDSVRGKLPRTAYDFNAGGEVFLLDFDENEEIEVVRPEIPWNRREPS